MSEIVIYQTPDNQTEIEVQYTGETFWLSLQQIATLFERDKSVISRHLKIIFESGELQRDSVVAKNATTASDGKTYLVEYFNLDAILSVGYRVNSKQGTTFRIWANRVLKSYLEKGYALNQQRLGSLGLGRLVEIAQQLNSEENLQIDEAKGLLNVLSAYTKSLSLLNQYDSRRLPMDKLCEDITYEISYEEAKAAVASLKNELIAKNEASELFGKEKDNSFRSSLYSVVQTFGGEYLYPSIEEQAAHLLYFVIKNHSFTDGNKRIGAFLFMWFLEKNNHRFKQSGEIKINDNALTAIALLVAQSAPEDKELMVALVVNLVKN